MRRPIDATAGEAYVGGKHFFVGVGVGKLVSAGTDVGLSASARRCLDLLIDRATAHELVPSLNLVQVKDVDAAECARHAMRVANDGDILFFFVDEAAACDAVMRAVGVWATSHWRTVQVGGP